MPTFENKVLVRRAKMEAKGAFELWHALRVCVDEWARADTDGGWVYRRARLLDMRCPLEVSGCIAAWLDGHTTRQLRGERALASHLDSLGWYCDRCGDRMPTAALDDILRDGEYLECDPCIEVGDAASYR